MEIFNKVNQLSCGKQCQKGRGKCIRLNLRGEIYVPHHVMVWHARLGYGFCTIMIHVTPNIINKNVTSVMYKSPSPFRKGATVKKSMTDTESQYKDTVKR